MTNQNRIEDLKEACQQWSSLGHSHEEMVGLARNYNEHELKPPLDDADVMAVVECVVEAQVKEGGASALDSLSRKFERGEIGLDSINDMELGRLFGDLFRDQLRYEPESGLFYYFNGKFWEADLGGLHTDLLAKLFVDMLMAHQSDFFGREWEEYVKTMGRYRAQAARARLVKDIRSELRVDADSFDASTYLINAANCTIDLRTFETHPHRASDMLTKCMHANYSPKATCELWEQVLARSFEGDVDTMEYFQKALGMSVLGDTSLALLHVLGFVPRSGKTLTMGTIVNLLGTGRSGYSCVVPGDTFEKSSKPNGAAAREDLMLMRGTRVAVVNESSQGMVLDAALVKQITGGDLVTARGNYEKFSTFKMLCNIFIVTNYSPTVTDRTIFESGRMRVVPFEHAVPPVEQDTSLGSRLSEPACMSGILNWLLDGARKYSEDGLEPSLEVYLATDEVDWETDYVGQFIVQEMTLADVPKNSLKQVHDRYQAWCSPNIAPLDKDDFEKELNRYGFTVFHGRKNGIRNPVIGYALQNQCDSDLQ